MKPNLLFVNLPNVPLEDSLEAPSSNSFLSHKKFMPLGILYLSSYLKQHNSLGSVSLADYAGHFEQLASSDNLDESILDLAQQAVDADPDVILYSLMFSVSHNFCMRTIDLLRTRWPDATVIVGGVHATNYTQTLLENPSVDYVARGEAELALSEFLRCHPLADSDHVPGIYASKDLPLNDPLALCQFPNDLDQLPFPDWDLIDMDIYTALEHVTVYADLRDSRHPAKSAAVLTTRGCSNRCTFCSQHTVHGRKLRFRSVDNVIAEIELLHERFGVTTFIPTDDMFISGHKRDLHLLKRIRSLGIDSLELQFPIGLSINALNLSVMDALIDCGTKVVNLAIESGSPHVQKHIIKKNVNLPQAKRVVDYFRQRNVCVRCFFILGFPDETLGQMKQTIDFAESLGADWCDFFVAVPLIGSEMYDQFARAGCIDPANPDFSHTFFLTRTFDTPQISAEQIEELTYRANLKCNFLNNPNRVPGRYQRAISLFENIVAGYPFHIIAWHSMMDCYTALENSDQAARIRKRIEKLLLTDPLAADMFRKYSDLLPDMG